MSCLQVEAGQCCSRHYHEERVNQFSVLEGTVVVEVWDKIPSGVREDDKHYLETKGKLRILNAGDVLSVPTFKVHRFRVVRSGRMVEVYYPPNEDCEVQQDDIIRLDVGGPDPVPEILSDLDLGEPYDG